MKRHTPPLNSLRGFEAVARHLSVTRAAAELNVTPGAVSQQVKTLEAYLGVKLFRRHNRKLQLTEPARACLPLVSAGFANLAAAVEATHHHNAKPMLRVTVAPTLGTRWLVPRLGAFRKAHPDINLSLDASVARVDLTRDQFDLGIRFGSGKYPELESTPLFATQVVPVCSPSLLKSAPKLKTPRDLKNHTLLHADYPWGHSLPDWQTWLHGVGIDHPDTQYGIRFTNPEMVMQAALDGQGIALFSSVLVAQDLANQRLILPLKESLCMDYAYHIIQPKKPALTPQAKAFRAWLLAQAAKMPDFQRSD